MGDDSVKRFDTIIFLADDCSRRNVVVAASVVVVGVNADATIIVVVVVASIVVSIRKLNKNSLNISRQNNNISDGMRSVLLLLLIAAVGRTLCEILLESPVCCGR